VEKRVVLTLVVLVLGPPGAGKTTLTAHLARMSGQRIFRLREHVSRETLIATASSADRLGWIDDAAVAAVLHDYVDVVARSAGVHTVLLDNFPGAGPQVGLLLSVLRKAAPDSSVRAVELVATPAELGLRAVDRRVCQQCERDPVGDPRLPVVADRRDPRRCGECGHVLGSRRGDSPALLSARMLRYRESIATIRSTMRSAGVPVRQISSECSLDEVADALAPLLDPGRSGS
jgi:adenylate kinase family enzyme